MRSQDIAKSKGSINIRGEGQTGAQHPKEELALSADATGAESRLLLCPGDRCVRARE